MNQLTLIRAVSLEERTFVRRARETRPLLTALLGRLGGRRDPDIEDRWRSAPVAGDTFLPFDRWQP